MEKSSGKESKKKEKEEALEKQIADEFAQKKSGAGSKKYLFILTSIETSTS